MANPQPTEPHLRIAHSIGEQLMVSNFTEQQRRILDLILRLSWGCNKEIALIPKQKDFEIVGVREGHIKAHLDCLVRDRVICRNDTAYSFNRNFNEWRVSRAFNYSPEKLTDLVSLNLRNQSQQLTDSVSENLRNREVGTYGIGKSAETGLASAKESLKKRTESELEKDAVSLQSAEDFKNTAVVSLYTEVFGNNAYDENIRCELEDMCRSYPQDWLKSAFGKARSARARSLRYVLTILEDYSQKGGPDADSGRKHLKPAGAQPPDYVTRGLEV